MDPATPSISYHPVQPITEHTMHTQNATEIIPRIWLGNFMSAKDEQFIRAFNITTIFNCTKDIPFFIESIPNKYRVPLDDNLEEVEIRNLCQWSVEVAYKIMSEYKNGKTILVHCYAGRQRSAACVAIFLIAYYYMHTDNVITAIRQKRPEAFMPGANFERAIRYFDSIFHSQILPSIQ